MQTTLKILSYLATHISQNKWQLSKKLEKSYGNVHASMKKLLEKDPSLIKLAVTRKSKTNPKMSVDFYGLTLHGLIEALLANLDLWKETDSIAKIHEKKLLIFEKWKFFEEEGLTDNITKALQITLASIVKTQVQVQLSFGKKMKWTEEELRDLVDSMTLGCYEIRTSKDPSEFYLKILEAAKKDEDLWKFIEEELQQFEDIALKQVDRIKKIKKTMKPKEA